MGSRAGGQCIIALDSPDLAATVESGNGSRGVFRTSVGKWKHLVLPSRRYIEIAKAMSPPSEKWAGSSKKQLRPSIQVLALLETPSLLL